MVETSTRGISILIIGEIPLIFHGSRPENCGVHSEFI